MADQVKIIDASSNNLALVNPEGGLAISSAETSFQQTVWDNTIVVNTTITQFVGNYSSIMISHNPSGSITGGTIVFEATPDGGISWFPMMVMDIGTGIALSSFNLSGQTSKIFRCAVLGLSHIRIRLSAVITGTGSITFGRTAHALPTSDFSAVISNKDLVTGRTLVAKTGTLVTTAATADQVVLTYTVPAGKTFYLEYIALVARLTAISATASILGTISVETPSGTKIITLTMINPTTSLTTPIVIPMSEPLPIAAGVVIRIVTTPTAVTSMTWIGNFGGYEK